MKKILVLVLLFLYISELFACTILSGTDLNGHTWICNNEDESFSFKNYINVFPRDGGSKNGYVTLTYGSPGGKIEGGLNEAGLFFDFNQLLIMCYP